MLAGVLRAWWWRRGYRRFYVGEGSRANPYTLNAGTWERFDALVEELARLLAPAPDDAVLDLGGGNGQVAARLFPHCRRVVILDFCQDAMGSGPPLPRNCFFVVGEMSHPPFKPATFTKIFTYSTFPHLGSQRRVRQMLPTWDRLLDDGGTLYIGDVPDRRALPRVLASALGGIARVSGLKYCFAAVMNSYFSRTWLARDLAAMGYSVTILDQSPGRRFSTERFDILARKAAGPERAQSALAEPGGPHQHDG